MSTKTWYVYAHFTKDTNELFYIGVGTGDRMKHDSKSKRSSDWHEIVCEHGGFEYYIIIDDFTDRDEAVKEEVRLQLINKPRGCLRYGDNNLAVVSEVTRKKQSESQKIRKISEESILGQARGWFKKGFAPWNKGKFGCFSEDTRLKMSKAQKGKKLSEEHRKNISEGQSGEKSHFFGTKGELSPVARKVKCIETGEVFPSITAAAQNISRAYSTVANVLRGLKKTAGGYHWEYI